MTPWNNGDQEALLKLASNKIDIICLLSETKKRVEQHEIRVLHLVLQRNDKDMRAQAGVEVAIH